MGFDPDVILGMDIGTDSVKVMISGIHEDPLVIPAVISRFDHHPGIKAKTRFGVDAYRIYENKLNKETYDDEISSCRIVYTHYRHPLNKNSIFRQKDNTTDQKSLLNLIIDREIHDEGKIDASRTAICVTEPSWILRTKNYREEMLKWIFEERDFCSALIVPEYQGVLSYFDLHTALIVDIGEVFSRCVSVMDDKVDFNSFKYSPIAGFTITSHLKQSVECKIPNELRHWINYLNARKIKESRGYVSMSFGRDLLLNNKCRGISTYPINDKDKIDIGSDAFVCNEIFFDPGRILQDLDSQSIPQMIVDCVKYSSIDYRKELLSNILLVGGSSNTPNLSKRLKVEVGSTWFSSLNIDKAEVNSYNSTRLRIRQKSDAVIRGAMKYALRTDYGQEDIWIYRSQYEESGYKHLSESHKQMNH